MNSENQGKILHPRLLNEYKPEGRNFLNVIGFCEIDEKSHYVNEAGEGCRYVINGKVRYELIRKNSGVWEVVEFNSEGRPIARSSGQNRDRAVYQALCFSGVKHEDTADIIFPVFKGQQENVVKMFYVIGGYPGFLITDGERMHFIKAIGLPEHAYIAIYKKVPKDYLPWLIESLGYLKMTNPKNVFTVRK